MNLKTWCSGLVVATLAGLAPAQEIQRLDPLANKIVPQNARLERVLTGFDKWTEGPVWTHQGSLLFAEIPANKIDRWIPGGTASVFIHPSGYTGAAPYNGPEPGSNGMTLDAAGRLTVAGHARRNVWRLESMDPSSPMTILADSYQGKQLNSPNDLVYKSDGALYFTDPPYGLRTQGDSDPEKQLRINGVYRIPNAARQKPGSPPDEKLLYVSDSQKKVWMRYAVAADGSVHGGALFQDANGDKLPGGPDGIKVDKEGNLYGAAPGGVWVISPAGKHILTIRVPEVVGNLAWGDSDGKTLYVTASTSVYRIRLSIPGMMPR